MQQGDEETLCNLRLLGSIKEGYYPCTDSLGNICGSRENTYFNSFLAGVTLENWNCTQYFLKKLFTEQLPPLIDKLIEKEYCDELDRVRTLISGSMPGFSAITDLYKYDLQRKAWLESIRYDYANMQVECIGKILPKVEKMEVSDNSDMEDEEKDNDE